jgi:hypothetical protein
VVERGGAWWGRVVKTAPPVPLQAAVLPLWPDVIFQETPKSGVS